MEDNALFFRAWGQSPRFARSEESEWPLMDKAITNLLKGTVEQRTVVGPLVQRLVSLGWDVGQMVFGKKEWRIPKTPSEATKREKGHSFSGFPVDIAIFDKIENCGDPSHILFIVECKRQEERAGISQLEAYFVGEPHAQLGIWANNAEETAQGVFLYRGAEGRAILKRASLKSLPRSGEAILPDSQAMKYADRSTLPISQVEIAWKN